MTVGISGPIVFQSIGMGMSAAGQWVELAGDKYWVSFLATAEGARRHERITARRRTWHISATIQERGRFTISKPNSTRTEALGAILIELELLASGSPGQRQVPMIARAQRGEPTAPGCRRYDMGDGFTITRTPQGIWAIHTRNGITVDERIASFTRMAAAERQIALWKRHDALRSTPNDQDE